MNNNMLYSINLNPWILFPAFDFYTVNWIASAFSCTTTYSRYRQYVKDTRMSLSRFVSDALWDSLVTHSLPVWPFNFRSCGNSSRRCVHACIYTSVNAWLPQAVYMHSLLELHLFSWFYIACLSLQSFAFLNCFNLIVIFKAMGRYCEPASCWSYDNKLKNLQKYPWMRDVTWVKFPTNSTSTTRAT